MTSSPSRVQTASVDVTGIPVKVIPLLEFSRCPVVNLTFFFPIGPKR